MRALQLVSSQGFKGTGGIGTAIQGVTNTLNQLGYVNDILLDKAIMSSDNSEQFAECINANVIFGPEPKNYKAHIDIHTFRITINWDLVATFRTAIFDALKKNTYDLCVIHTVEACWAAYSLELYRHMPLVFYSHDPNSIFADCQSTQVFSSSHLPLVQSLQILPGLVLGTHSIMNQHHLSNQGFDNLVLPLSISEPELLTHKNDEKSGVLFIGRWEPRKQPKKFVKLIKETGLPAKVMTTNKSAQKFTRAFEEAGIKDYEIKSAIWGKEKVDFIGSAKVFYMPSNEESFGLAAYEALTQMAVVAHKKYEWTKNFELYESFYAVEDDTTNEMIQSLYYAENQNSLEHIQKHEEWILTRWKFNYKQEQSNSTKATVLEHEDFWFHDYINSFDRRVGIDDIQSVLINRHHYTVTHTQDGTWFSKTGKIAEEKKSYFDELFT